MCFALLVTACTAIQPKKIPHQEYLGSLKRKNSSEIVVSCWGIQARIQLELEDCRFEKPVRTDLLTGRVYQIDDFEYSNGGTEFHGLPLRDYPFILAEMDEIEMD
jgi:hypothetical protein